MANIERSAAEPIRSALHEFVGVKLFSYFPAGAGICQNQASAPQLIDLFQSKRDSLWAQVNLHR